MENNLHIFYDIFNTQLFNGIVCEHYRELFKMLGLTWRTFLKLYTNKFNPDLDGINSWRIVGSWGVKLYMDGYYNIDAYNNCKNDY